MASTEPHASPVAGQEGDGPKPFISSRVYIKWFDAEGKATTSEPTSTIILAVPEENYFVDVRINKDALQRHGPNDQTTIELSPDDLDWANAGQSSSVDLPDDPVWETRKSFTHWVDSRFELGATPPPDVGDFRDAGDGTDESIEVGEMVNPATGTLQRYEERWATIGIRQISVDPSGRKEDRWMALRADDQATGTRGVVILLGQYMESILRREGKLYVERWEFRDGDERSDGGYVLVARLGEAGILPDPKLVWDKKASLDHAGVQWSLFYRSF